MQSNRIFLPIVAFTILLLLMYSCSSDVTGARCETDEQCPSGHYCGDDKICHKGTKPIKDVGVDAGRDAGKDALTDVGKDTARDIEGEDILGDIGDIEDVGLEDINPDAEFPDVEEDAITDISSDVGGEVSINLKYNSVYDMSAGSVKTDEYTIRTVTGTNASPIINIDGMKIYKNKSHNK